MKIVDIDQSGADWHEWRSQGIGGSEAPTVMDENSFQCRDELADVKLGRLIVRENDAMRKGKHLESIARVKYQEITGIRCRPVCVISDQFTWLRASLDGLSEDGKIVLEIKCPTKPGTHLCALDGYVPHYYRAQTQHQLAVTDCDMLHFFTYYPQPEFAPDRQCALVKVYRDEPYIERLLRRERLFWEQLQREKEHERSKGKRRLQG